MEILSALIMLMIKSHGCANPNEQVALISRKQAIYNRFVQLMESEESDVKQLYKQDSSRKVGKEKNMKQFLHGS